MLCTLFQKEEAIAVALSYSFSPNHSFPGLVVCVHSRIEISQEDEFACLLPDEGCLSVIRRSFMPFGSPESLLTRCDLVAKPTPASCRSTFLRPLQTKV